MCGNKLNLVNSFSVMLGWVDPALSKNWLCLLVLSADNLGKQLDPDQTLSKRRTSVFHSDARLHARFGLLNNAFCLLIRLYDVKHLSQ